MDRKQNLSLDVVPPFQRLGKLDAKALNGLTAVERLAAVQSCQGREKLNLLIEAIDGPQLLQKLPLQEVYLLLRQVGIDDVQELFAMCSSEQLCGFLDLAGWQAGELKQQAILDWLALLFEAGEEKALLVFREMDFELLCLLVQKSLKVISGPEQLEDDDARAESLSREGGYVVEYNDELSGKLVGHLIDVLFRYDLPLYLRLLESVRRELPAELEEAVACFREGRLLDNGFPPLEEARLLFAWNDPDKFDRQQHLKVAEFDFPTGLEAPSVLMRVQPASELLVEILSRGITSEEAWELTYLLNKLMQANQIDVGDEFAVGNGLEQLYATLNLGLDHLSQGDFEMAASLWRDIYAQAIFQQGFSLTLKLKHRAKRLLTSSLGQFFPLPAREFLDALILPAPRFYPGLESGSGGNLRWFRSRKDLMSAEDGLAQLELQQRLFSGLLPFELPEVEMGNSDQVTLITIYCTALANRLLGREFAPIVLTKQDLFQLHPMVSGQGKVKSEVFAEARSQMERLEKGGSAFVDEALGVMEEGFCSLELEDIDSRFVPFLVVAQF